MDQDKREQMSIERALEIWGGAGLSESRRKSRVLHYNADQMITLAGNFTADQLEVMAVLLRTGEI